MTTQPVTPARFRPAALAALAACALALAGCQGGTPGSTESTTAAATTSATPTPTPTPSAVYMPADAQGKAQNVPVPVKPALADENSKAGLEAFVGYWFALLNYGYETGDLSAWTALTDGGCAFCTKLEDVVDKATADGRWMTGGKFSTPSIDAKWKENASSQAVIVQVLQGKIDYFKADGSTAGPSSAETNIGAGVTGAFVQEGWKVQDMGILR